MLTIYKQGKGRWNKDYWTVQFIGNKKMNWWRYNKGREEIDLMLKYSEVAEIIESLLTVENEKKRPIKYKILKEALEKGMSAPYLYNKISSQ